MNEQIDEGIRYVPHRSVPSSRPRVPSASLSSSSSLSPGRMEEVVLLDLSADKCCGSSLPSVSLPPSLSCAHHLVVKEFEFADRPTDRPHAHAV